MYFATNGPGPWQYFITRPDNVGKPLMDVRNKYLQEQILFENYMSFVQQQQLMMSNASAGGGPPFSSSIDLSENNYVVNNYIDNYFE